jgi:hypothetical protein
MATILSKEQLSHILRVYAEDSPAAARELAPGYGILPSYVKKLANIHRVKCKKRIRGANKKPSGHADPRWLWAVERGEIRI